MNAALSLFGALHPAFVHLPLGAAVILVLLELAPRAGSDAARGARRVVLLAGAGGAALASAAGLALALRSGGDAALLSDHRLLGALAALAAAAALAAEGHRASALVFYRAAVAAFAVLSALAGRSGGVLRHGPEEFGLSSLGPARPAPGAAESEFRSAVLPVLERNCFACHSTAQAKGGLRLDTRPATLASGRSGRPAVVPGDPGGSELVRRLLADPASKGAMPPPGKPRPSDAEVLALARWVERGAAWAPAPDPKAVAALRARGAVVETLADREPLLRVDFRKAPRRADEAGLAALGPLSEHVAWLDLSGTAVTDASLGRLSGFPALTRLNLANTAVGDAGLAAVGGLRGLEYLNLYGTRVTDAGLERLRGLSGLKSLYLWRTAVTPGGARRLAASLPGLAVNAGAPPAD